MYVVELDVFHQLHCLNTLRKSLYPEIYPTNNATVSRLFVVASWCTNVLFVQFSHGIHDRQHLEHCVNSLRESLMVSFSPASVLTAVRFLNCLLQCSADLTPNVWKWSIPLQVSDPYFNSVHTCRNWDTIHEWAIQNTARVKFDKKRLIPDDLKYPKVPFENVIQRYIMNPMYDTDA